MAAAALCRRPARGVTAYEEAGIDELLLNPSVADLDQVDPAAGVVFT